MIRLRSFTIAVLCIALASVANASWYDDYDAGIKAARAGNWSVVVDRMTKAINGNGKEDNKARTYGAIFINYHPYYYRGVANLNLGRYDQAISDLEKTSGPGPLDLGSIDTLIQRAKSSSEGPSTAPSVPDPTPSRPSPPVQTGPVIDNALRSRAQAAIEQATQRVASARQRNAQSPQLSDATRQLVDANTRFGNAQSNADINAALTAANNAVLFADAVVSPAVIPNTPAVATNTRTVPPPPPTRPQEATAAVLATSQNRLRAALESYFRGDFEEASRGFQALTRDMPRNGWVWAFLGASQYSQYAFEADESYRNQAITAFKQARRLVFGRNGLPTKYFSKRIRTAFEKTAG